LKQSKNNSYAMSTEDQLVFDSVCLSTDMIVFTQSTAVLHKYLSEEWKYFVCYNFICCCTEFPDDSVSFPSSEESLSEYSVYVFQVCGHPMVVVHVHPRNINSLKRSTLGPVREYTLYLKNAPTLQRYSSKLGYKDQFCWNLSEIFKRL